MRHVKRIGSILALAGLATGTAFAGVVVLTDGSYRTGRVIVRYQTVTLQGDDLKLYQFPGYLVHRIEVLSPTDDYRIAVDKGYLYRQADKDGGVIDAVYPGNEYQVLERKGEWARVNGSRNGDAGWVLAELLGERVVWNPLDKQAAEPDLERLRNAYNLIWSGTETPGVGVPTEEPQTEPDSE